MGELVDARPDRFLREMRASGDWDIACERSGLTTDEAEALCAANPQFDLAAVECQLKHIEESIDKEINDILQEVYKSREVLIRSSRELAMKMYKARHG